MKEANLITIESHVHVSTALLAEKFCRYTPDDPLYILAHQALPPKRLRRISSWQYLSDSVLREAGFNPSRNDTHHISQPPHLFSLSNRTPFSPIPQLNPWDLQDFDNHILVVPTLEGITKKNTPTDKLKHTATTQLIKLGPFDHSFWTDGSYFPRTHYSAAACISYQTQTSALDILPQSSMSQASPTGLAAASYTPELLALDLPQSLITSSPSSYNNSKIFIGTDSQSCLTALNPLKRPKFGKLDPTSTLKKALNTARTYNIKMHYQWIPSHVGLTGNEAANDLAITTCRQTTRTQQLNNPIAPATIRRYLLHHEQKRFHNLIITDSAHHTGSRYIFCGLRKTNFQARANLPRSLQCLFSRWRLGQVDSCGNYPRHLGYTETSCSLCRLCGLAPESPLHLLTECPRLFQFRFARNISLETLRYDSPGNILSIAYFDRLVYKLMQVAQPKIIQDALYGAACSVHIKRIHPPEIFSMSGPVAKCARLCTYVQRRKRPLLIPSSSPSKRQHISPPPQPPTYTAYLPMTPGSSKGWMQALATPTQ